jgi:hypothetical protein
LRWSDGIRSASNVIASHECFSERRNLIAFSIALDRGPGTGNNPNNHKIDADSFSLRKPVADMRAGVSKRNGVKSAFSPTPDTQSFARTLS